jgi:transcriptional regulator with XRE-family HTH domain
VGKREDDWAQRVAEVINSRMENRGMTQGDLVKASGISDTKLRELQKGLAGNPRDATLRKVSLGLGLKAGALIDVRHGKELPSEPTGSEVPAGAEDIPSQLAEMRQLQLEFRQGQNEQGRALGDLVTKVDAILATLEAAAEREAG